jgi:fructosamine-3-kinase
MNLDLEMSSNADTTTRGVVLFDAGSMYAHNEMEFGTWRRPWTTYLRQDLRCLDLYKECVKPSWPVEECDGRNRLYGLHALLNDSAGHPGSGSRVA